MRASMPKPVLRGEDLLGWFSGRPTPLLPGCAAAGSAPDAPLHVGSSAGGPIRPSRGTVERDAGGGIPARSCPERQRADADGRDPAGGAAPPGSLLEAGLSAL